MAKRKTIKEAMWSLTQKALAARDRPQAIPVGLTPEEELLCKIHDNTARQLLTRNDAKMLRRICVSHIYHKILPRECTVPRRRLGPKTAHAIIAELDKIGLTGASVEMIRHDMRDFVLKHDPE